MTINAFVKIKLEGGGSYILPRLQVGRAIEDELDGVETGDSITVTITPTRMTNEEYDSLPEFPGH